MVVKRIKKYGARLSAYLAAFMLLKAASWIDWMFGSPPLEQIIFHLQNGTAGIADADPDILKSFAVHVVLLPAIFATALFGAQEWLLSQKCEGLLKKLCSSKYISYIWLGRFASVLRTGFKRYIPVGLLIIAGVVMANKVALWSYLKNHELSEFIAENYVNPGDIKAPQKKLNLVLIYVESFETGYSNATIMGSDLLAPLTKSTKSGYSFKRLVQATGTGWTMAGIVSSQCGIPLKSTSLLNVTAQKEKEKSFLPNAICLGDILMKQGYENIFMGGASLYFAAKGSFFSQHGYAEAYGKEDWSRNGNKNFNEWGLFDDALFANAKAKLDQLYKNKRPFNLTLLTVDTHPPNGYLSPTCQKQGAANYKDIVSCTALQLADFIDFMKRKGYLKNTVVVVMGDHQAGGTPLEPDLNKTGQRTIYNRFVTPTRQSKNREEIYHFGVFPTILYAMGFRFEKNRLGLGASGFGELDTDFIIPSLKIETVNELLAKSSKKYLDFMNTAHDNNYLSQESQKN